MQSIKIVQRLKPFSHVPGARCLIPGTSYFVEAFPALMRIRTLQGEIVKEKQLTICGPLRLFTLMQDLEKGCVTLFSEAYRWHILPNLSLVEGKTSKLSWQENQERLSFGNHKKQEWEAIRKRLDFREIFPLWFRLGSLVHLPARQCEDKGMFSLLEAIQQTIRSNKPEHILPHFEKLFLAGFGSHMIPRLQDEEHQGILQQETPNVSPLYLLQEGAQLIRSLFFQSHGNEISILPNLPPECFSGRMLHLKGGCATVNLEWSKKTIRQVHIRAEKEALLKLHFQSGLKSFRLRTHESERSKVFSCGEVLEIKSGIHYLLDQFQK